MGSRIRYAALALAGAFALSGCMQFHADLTVSEDDTVDGTYVVALEQGAGASFGASNAEVARSLFEDSGLQTEYLHSREHGFAADGFEGTQIDFRDEPLDTFAPTDDRFGITREGDEYVVSGRAPSTTADDSGDTSQIQPGEMTFSITFPGAVTSSNGRIDGDTVTWDVAGGPETFEARASAVAASSPWPAIAATAVVMLAAAVAWWPRTPKSTARPPSGRPAQRRTSAKRPAPARRPAAR